MIVLNDHQKAAMKLLAGLWRKESSAWTPEEADLWKELIAEYNGEWMCEVLREYKRSEPFAPKMCKVLEKYRAYVRDQRVTEDALQRVSEGRAATEDYAADPDEFDDDKWPEYKAGYHAKMRNDIVSWSKRSPGALVDQRVRALNRYRRTRNRSELDIADIGGWDYNTTGMAYAWLVPSESGRVLCWDDTGEKPQIRNAVSVEQQETRAAWGGA